MAFAYPYPFSKFKVYNVDPKDLKRFEVKARNESMDIAFYTDEPGATTGVEDFYPGTTFEWDFMHDEVQYILLGKAVITYSLPPLHDKVQKTTAQKGSIYLVPRGTHAKFRIVSKAPYRHLFVVMPGGFYPQDKKKRR